MNKAYKFRIYPNETQKILFSKTFGCTRMVYNYYLDKRIKLYEQEKITFGYTTVCVNHNIKLENGTVTLPKIGKVKVRQHRNIPDNYILKSVTVSQTPSGKY